MSRYPRLLSVYHSSSTKIDLVNGLCTRKSKEPKDKALALQTVLQRLTNSTLPALDSSRTLEDIYHEFTIQIIEVFGSLELLSRAGLCNLLGCPSWVPNWSADFDPIWVNPHLSGNQPLDATPGSASYWKLTPGHKNMLRVRGHRVAAVLHVY